MKLNKENLLLYAVTDRHWLGDRSLYEQVLEAVLGGVTFLQVREKDVSKGFFIEESLKIKALAKEYNVPLVINDDVDVAKAIDADGVHIGQDDMNAKDARAIVGDDKIIGVSAQTVEQAIIAQNDGADYLGVGAVFNTTSKDDADSVDRKTLRAICEAVDIPVIAIGGINERNISQLKDCGICGVAIISAIFGADDIKKSTNNLKELAKGLL